MQRSPRRFATTIAVATTIIVIAVGASVFYHNSGRSNVSAKSPSLTPAPLNSIAVLPLQNITRDPTQDYFSDGLTESFITNLSRIQGLKVISRSSAFTLKGQTNTQEIGNKLGVSTVLEGAVQQDGDRVRVSVRLVNAADGRVLWTSQTYDRELKDIFNVEDEIACSITAELRVKLCGEVDSSRHYTENIAAYQAYLKGRYLINNQYTELNTVGPVRNLEQAIMYFQQAAKIDPNYAPAYAGLADAYTGMVWFSPEEPKALIERAKAAALKANELDDTLASAHTALGTVYIHEWNFAAAGQEYERAVALNPGDAAAHDGYATYLMAAGRVAEMLTETKRAVELDPLNVYISGDRGSCLYFARKYDESIAEFQRLNDVAQDAGAAGNIGLCYLGKGMYPEAVTAFQTAKARTTVKGLVPNAIANLAIGRAMAGNKAEAERLLNELTAMAKTQYVPQTFFAGIYTALDQKNRAFVSLNKAYQRHDSTLIGLKLSPLFDPLRSDPRFADILRDVRLPSD
jgi:TolB-like protein/Tfp pilus assembly protein PilF